MNKYAEEMQKIALNRLAKYMIEHPQHADVLAGMLRHDPGPVAFAGLPRGASNPKLGISLEQRRAAHREMSSVKPMLRHPAQYAEGMHDAVDARIPKEVSVGKEPGKIVHMSGPKADAEEAAATSAANVYDTRKAVQDTEWDAKYGPWWKKLGGRAQRAASKAKEAHASALAEATDAVWINRLGRGTGEGPDYQRFLVRGDNTQSHLLNLPSRNLSRGAATGSTDDGIASIQGAVSAHHELDEFAARKRQGFPSEGGVFYGHAGPEILAREARRQRGNPYTHLTYRPQGQEFGTAAGTYRDNSGEASAIAGLMRKPPAPGTPFNRFAPTGRDLNAMKSMPASEASKLQEATEVPPETFKATYLSSIREGVARYGMLPKTIPRGAPPAESSFARADTSMRRTTQHAEWERRNADSDRKHADLMARARAVLAGGT